MIQQKQYKYDHKNNEDQNIRKYISRSPDLYNKRKINSFDENNNDNRIKSDDDYQYILPYISQEKKEREQVVFDSSYLQQKRNIIKEEVIKNLDIQKIHIKKNHFNIYRIDRDNYSFPLTLQILVYYGNIELYVSSEKYPCVDDNNFAFTEFSTFPTIDFTSQEESIKNKIRDYHLTQRFTLVKNQQKEETQGWRVKQIYMSFFTSSDALFTFKPIFETNQTKQNYNEEKMIMLKQKIQQKYKKLEEKRILQVFQQESKAVEMSIVDIRKENKLKDIAQKPTDLNTTQLDSTFIKKNLIIQSPSEKQNCNQEQLILKEVKTIRNKFIKGKYDLAQNNSSFLKVVQKKEKNFDIATKEERIKRELISLKSDFQSKWCCILSFVSLMRCMLLRFKIAKNKKINQEIQISRVQNKFLLLNTDIYRFGANQDQRIFSNCLFAMNLRFNLFLQKNELNAGYYIKNFILKYGFLKHLQQKLNCYYDKIVRIQQVYREYAQRKQELLQQFIYQSFNIQCFSFKSYRYICQLWDIALNNLTICENTCLTKGLIDKVVFQTYSQQLRDIKVSTLKNLLDQQYSLFIEKIMIYNQQFKELRMVDRIIIAFFNFMEVSFLQNQIKNKIQKQYFQQNEFIQTDEFIFNTLSTIQNFNIYTIKDTQLKDKLSNYNLPLLKSYKNLDNKLLRAHTVFQENQSIFQNLQVQEIEQILIEKNEEKNKKFGKHRSQKKGHIQRKQFGQKSQASHFQSQVNTQQQQTLANSQISNSQIHSQQTIQQSNQLSVQQSMQQSVKLSVQQSIKLSKQQSIFQQTQQQSTENSQLTKSKQLIIISTSQNPSSQKKIQFQNENQQIIQDENQDGAKEELKSQSTLLESQQTIGYYFSKPYLNFMIELNSMYSLLSYELSIISQQKK